MSTIQENKARSRQRTYPKVLGTIRTGVAVCVYAYAIAVFCVWGLIWTAGDRWWFATLLLMGPRWIYAVPMVVLLPPAIFWRHRWLWTLGVSAIVIVGPIMGFNVPLGWGDRSEPQDIRVMTFNIHRWHVCTDDFAALLDTVSPDIVAVQECPTRTWEIPPEWFVQRAGELIVVSRYPILRSETSRCLWPTPEKEGIINALYCLVDTPSGPVGFCNIHLDTPKPALQQILDPRIVLDLTKVDYAETLLSFRRLESKDLADWVAKFPEPMIIAGDFNMPVESGLYRDYWSGNQNAFSRAGVGLGHTKHTVVDRFHFGSRIDHIITCSDFHAIRCWLAPDLGSDHLPLIADLERTKKRPTSDSS